MLLTVGGKLVLPQASATRTVPPPVPAVCVHVSHGVVDGVAVENPVEEPAASKLTATGHRLPGQRTPATRRR
jgi:hypothetical protein